MQTFVFGDQRSGRLISAFCCCFLPCLFHTPPPLPGPPRISFSPTPSLFPIISSSFFLYLLMWSLLTSSFDLVVIVKQKQIFNTQWKMYFLLCCKKGRVIALGYHFVWGWERRDDVLPFFLIFILALNSSLHPPGQLRCMEESLFEICLSSIVFKQNRH